MVEVGRAWAASPVVLSASVRVVMQSLSVGTETWSVVALEMVSLSSFCLAVVLSATGSAASGAVVAVAVV